MSKTTNQFSQFLRLYTKELISNIETIDHSILGNVAELLLQTYRRNKHVYVIGNGGSASTASHIACDLGKGTVRQVKNHNEKRLRVTSLTDNIALMTAYANDFTFDDIFLEQLKNILEKGDVLIAISGSGNSKNIIQAVKYAKKIGAKTVGFLGFHTGGVLGKLVDVPLIVQSDHYGPVEDMHLVFGHVLSAWVAQVKKDSGKKKANHHVPFSEK